MPLKKVNNVQLYYEIKGDETSDKTIVFLNGVMASVSSWAFQTPTFEKAGFKILLHDFRGQLKSDKPKGPYTFAMHAEDTKALMEALDIKKAHLIGTSYGGEVAMRFAIDYPDMVETMVLINAVSELDDTLKAFIKSWKSLAALKDASSFFYGMMPSIYHADFIAKNEGALKARVEVMKQLNEDYYDGQITLYETFEDDVTMTDELHKITCPTLVVCGEDDILKPPKFSQIIANHIKKSEYVLLPNCAHVTIFEKPKELESILFGFIMKQKLEDA